MESRDSSLATAMLHRYIIQQLIFRLLASPNNRILRSQKNCSLELSEGCNDSFTQAAKMLLTVIFSSFPSF